MTPPRFTVEGFFSHGSRALIFASALDPAMNFSVSNGARLGGCELLEFLDMPRALDEHGRQRLDLYVFELRNGSDLNRIEVGAIVELTARPVDKEGGGPKEAL